VSEATMPLDGRAGPPVPFRWLETLWIQVTGTLCNIACRHCFISCGPKATRIPVMSVAGVERALEEGCAAGMRQVYFTGGEPFLHPQIETLVERALDVAALTVVTNGILIDDAAAAWLARAFERSRYSLDLRVSLDGMNAAQNDPVRGGFLAFVRGLGIRQPRVKFLPLLRIGREERRTHGYLHRLEDGPLLPAVESSLLCASARCVTAQGVYTCPILVEEESARLGATVADASRPIRLGWSACQTCVLDGLRCNT
jgi:AdoMet-dependent heme synthase